MLQKISALFRNLAVYGLGDVATSAVSFLLLPIYVRYLSPTDYGVIALLLTVEVMTKIVYRWGIDASFMRFYYDCPDQPARQRLASTIFFFLLAVNGVLLAVALAAAPWMALHLFGRPGYELVLRLVLINTFLGGFYFIPFHVLRIQKKAGQFVTLTVSQQVATILARLALVIGARMGVQGVVLADLAVSAVFSLVLVRWFVPLIRPVFSRELLREVLRFGLPRVPHGAAHQVVAVSDRYILSLFVPLRDIGLYSMGATFGLGLKLFLSAFENAWAPFYFAAMKEPDAKRTFSGVTTYSFAALALLAAGLSAVAGDLVRLMTTPQYFGAARVIPWVALGVTLQGVYLLTSIGLNITRHTEYYPVATGITAAASVGLNLLLVPRVGMIGAAWANAAAYAVLASISMAFSQRFYPIAYEWNRLARVVTAALLAYALGRLSFPSSGAPLPGFLVRGTVVSFAFPVALLLLGFFRDHEIDRVRALAARFRLRRREGHPSSTAELAGEIAGAQLDGQEVGEEVGEEVSDEAGANARERVGPEGGKSDVPRDQVGEYIGEINSPMSNPMGKGMSKEARKP